MLNIFGEVVKIPTEEDKRKWDKAFKEYLLKEYDEKGSLHGRLCCGYDWMCDQCCQNHLLGNCQETAVDDCFDTIVSFLDKIDYFDYDFEKIEKQAYNSLKSKLD